MFVLPQNVERMVQLTIADCRESIWKNTPSDKRVQEDWSIKDVLISNSDDPLKTIMIKISPTLKEKRVSTIFELCNLDCSQLNSSNVLEYTKNHACLVLFDKSQTEIPFAYISKYNAVPHTRAVTNQTGKFYGREGSRSNCPIVFTRDYHRLSRSGIMGGQSNRAPELSSIKHKLELAPGPELSGIREELEQLPKLVDVVEQEALKKAEEKPKRMELKKMRTEMEGCKRKHREISKKLDQLKEQYQNQSQRKPRRSTRLSRTPVGSTDDGEPEGINLSGRRILCRINQLITVFLSACSLLSLVIQE